MTPTHAKTDAAPFLERCFFFDATEASYEITGISGDLPRWLRGSYYVNGPSRFTRGDFRYRHWLDGDGMVYAVHFTGDGVHYVSRFVGTRKLMDEASAGSPVYRCFGTSFSGDRLRYNRLLEAPANVSVYPFAGSILAFGEQSLPVELDPQTLETRGIYDFGGSLNELSPFAAHPKIDPVTGHMWNFGISYSPSSPSVTVYEFDSQGRRLNRRRYPLEFTHSNHDFGLSTGHAVFYLSPLLMNFDRFRDGGSVMESLSWRPELGSRILLAPRAGGDSFSIPVETAYCLHLINCFERDGELVVDLIEMDEPIYPEYQPIPEMFTGTFLGRPVRYRIDLSARKVTGRLAMTYDRLPDFPSIDWQLTGKLYDGFWLLGIGHAGRPGRKFFNQLARLSWQEGGSTEIYETESGCYLGGEPLVVSNPRDPRDAVVMVQHHNAEEGKTTVLLFDAFHLSDGPIVKMPLRHRLHPGFHSSFRPDALQASR